MWFINRYKRRVGPALVLALILLLAGCSGEDGVTGPPGSYDPTKLNAVSVPADPVIDGVVDALWSGLPALTARLSGTSDVHDPASINDCAGCHTFDSNVSVSLKAAYTAERLTILVTWNDPTASFTRGGSWEFVEGAWSRNQNAEQSEDRMSFFFPIGDITGDPSDTGGCMSKCHMYWPTATDPHISTHGIVDDAWLASGRADMWHSKAARSAAVISASGIGLTINPDTHEVTEGSFSMIGYADDKYVDEWADDATNGEDGGRYGDAGRSTYSHNRIANKSRPKYMETDPSDYADAMVLLQSEIDGGECVGDAEAGVSDADAAAFWPAYLALHAVVPERILRFPDGSRGDIKFGAVWDNGIWTAELSRDLNTGNDDDVQFDTSQEYPFNIAAFENSRHGYEHRTSKTYTLIFVE